MNEFFIAVAVQPNIGCAAAWLLCLAVLLFATGAALRLARFGFVADARIKLRRLSPLSRAFLALCFCVSMVFSANKERGGADPPAGRECTPPLRSDAATGPMFEVTAPRFSAIAISSNDVVALSAAWPEGALGGAATLDFFAKTNLLDQDWRWLGSASADAAATNADFSVAMAEIAPGTNAPPVAFFHFRHRESDCQTMRDFDGDGIPDVYELHNGTNPYIPDAALAPRIRVGSGAAYADIQDALEASTNYSIVSIAPETFVAHLPIELPAHPVMVAGEGGRATVRSDAATGAFIVDKGNDGRTLLRGLDVVLASRSSFQAAFWCGGNLPWDGVAATPLFEDIRIRAPYPEPLYYGWHFYSPTTNAVTIRDCTVNAAGAKKMHGIYSYDGPPLAIENCTFANFPQNHAGVFIQSASTGQGGTSNAPAAAIARCAFDESFSNAFPLARLGSAQNPANCFVAMRDCVVPSPLDPQYAPDFADGICVTNPGVGWNGIARPGGAAAALGVGKRLSAAFGLNADNDGDGLPDHDEAFVHETDPWLADSDFDELTDAEEITFGTNPKDRHSLFKNITAVSRRPGYASATTNYLAFGSTPDGWMTNSWTVVTNTYSTNVFVFATVSAPLFFAEFCDVNMNGEFEPGAEPIVTNVVSAETVAKTLAFDFVSGMDDDRDGIADLWECIHAGAGLSPTNGADAFLDPDGDGLLNIHEYWANSNPIAYDGTNTALYAAIHSIDDRLTSTNSLGRMPYYSSVSPSAITINPDCWAADIPLGSQSPYNSSDGQKKSGTLVSDRHLIFATHYPIGIGSKVYFHCLDGSVVTNTILDSRIAVRDITVGLLANAVDTNQIPIPKLLPLEVEDYLGSGLGLPVLALNQTDECLAMEFQGRNRTTGLLSILRFKQGERSYYSKYMKLYDSGNPIYLILGNTPVLLFIIWGREHSLNDTTYEGVNGIPISNYSDTLQETMNALCASNGVPSKPLQHYDFSPFAKLTFEKE